MRVKDLNKIESILSATIELVHEVGVFQISMKKISQKAGISAGTIYTYFESKEDLISQAYVKIHEDMSVQIAQGLEELSDKEKFITICMNFYREFTRNKNNFFFINQIRSSNFLTKELVMEADHYFVFLYDFLTEAIENKNISPTISLRHFLVYVLGGITNLAQSSLFEDSSISETDVQCMAQLAWKSIMVNQESTREEIS